MEENIKEASISSLVSTPRPPRKPLFPLDRFREEANDSSEKLEGENSTRSVHMKISASRLALSLSYFFSSFPSYRLQERSSCGKNAYANTGEREEGFQVGNERRKEDETRWKGYATHLPTSIYCDRADYICGRRYIRGESPFNWSPPRIDHADHPFPDPTVFIHRSCRYAVAS